MDEAMQLALEEETKNTFELAYLLFKKEFSKENLEKYIKEIRNLKYPEESNEKNKKLKLLNIFKEMLSYVSKITN